MNPEVPLENLEETITISRDNAELPPADDLTGRVFSERYEIQQLLGRGGMSVVYRARHILMDKVVAIKVLHMHLAKDDVSLRRFEQEATAVGALKHPNIVAIHDCGKSDDGTPYLVMDLVEGISLSDALEKNGPMPLELFLPIMQQVASALTHAHQCGIIHRDLKPGNIMITEGDGKPGVKLVDFGIAKMLTQSGDAAKQLTQTGEIFGSPLYMSPEQCVGAIVDHRCDIYSLACVMYEALSGKSPFEGDSVFETIHKHTNDPPPPLVAPQLDEPIRQKIEIILLRALAKAPEDRYQQMSELEAELRSLELKQKVGILTSLGGVWGLASAKRRAQRKNKLPLMVVTLTTVSCLSVISVLCLLGGLKKADSEISRLEQSRRILSEISLLQAEFTNISETGITYFTSIFLTPDKADLAKVAFEEAQHTALQRMEKTEKAIEHDPELAVPFKREWKGKLSKTLNWVNTTLTEMSADGGGFISHGHLTTSLVLAKKSQEAALILRKMTHEAKKAEKEQLGQFKYTEMWIGTLSILCAGLNGAVVISLFVYFARGTPQRLRKLTEQALQISRKRGLVQTLSNSDEVEDLDNVLQELATALSEAEDRERFLLEKLKEQGKVESN